MKQKLVKSIASLLAGAATTLAAGGAYAAAERTTLTVAYQDSGFPALVKKSGVLDEAPFDLKWVLLTGPAANLSALYSGTIDLGHMGDTSLTIEQANAKTEWTHNKAPLKIIAGWRNDYSPNYAPLVTAVRTSTGIDNVKSLAGRKWGYNFGGYNYAQHLVSLIKAGTNSKGVEELRFNDGSSSAAAFNAGQSEVFTGAQAAILDTLRRGDAKILLTDRDTGIPALNVWAARTEVLADPAKDAALKEFFSRLSGYWSWHDKHRETVIDTLRSTLKLTPERAEFEYRIRSGAFRPFDNDLLAKERAVADALFDAGAIARKVDVSIGFDARYNGVQKAVPVAQADYR